MHENPGYRPAYSKTVQFWLNDHFSPVACSITPLEKQPRPAPDHAQLRAVAVCSRTFCDGSLVYIKRASDLETVATARVSECGTGCCGSCDAHDGA